LMKSPLVPASRCKAQWQSFLCVYKQLLCRQSRCDSLMYFGFTKLNKFL
jgi:hypothetical protein